MYLHVVYHHLQQLEWNKCYGFVEDNPDTETRGNTKKWFEKHFSLSKLNDSRFELQYFPNGYQDVIGCGDYKTNLILS